LKLPEDDTEVSKHVGGEYYTMRKYCDTYLCISWL